MKNNLLYNLPPELQRYIYMFLNSITKPVTKKSKLNWCEKCGEILVNGDWFMSFSNEEPYLVYECTVCDTTNVFYDFGIIDVIVAQEID